MRFDFRIAITRFDFRIAVALGSITLMLVSVPLLTRHSASVIPNKPALPEAVVQIAPIVETAPVRESEVAKPAPERDVEIARPVMTEVPPPEPPAAVVERVSVPLPKERPLSVAGASNPIPVSVETIGVLTRVLLPKARPQHLADADKLALQPKQVVETSNPTTQVPLPKSRPQAIARVQPPAPAQAAGATSEPTVVAGVPMPKARKQDAAIAEDSPAPQRADLKAATASAEPAPSSGELANASVDSAIAIPDATGITDASERAPSVAEFRPPMPKVRPASIDRLILVAEMRKYMGTNPTKRNALWCATFMNMVLNKLGYKGTKSDAARSFVDYGRRIPGPKVGAIAVLTRGPNGGHVGVVSGVDKHGNPIIVSGNHGHRVGVGTYPRSRVIAYVLPTPREFKRAAARFSEHTQRSSQVTTQFAARSTPSHVEKDVAELPIIELLAAIAAEHSEGRPGSASLRSRASHGKPVTSLLAKFLRIKS